MSEEDNKLSEERILIAHVLMEQALTLLDAVNLNRSAIYLDQAIGALPGIKEGTRSRLNGSVS